MHNTCQRQVRQLRVRFIGCYNKLYVDVLQGLCLDARHAV